MRDAVERLLRDTGRRSRGAIVAGVRAGDETVIAAWAPRGVVADRRSVFEIGSVTKPFTAILLAEMVERGEVALADRLGDHLPVADDLGLADVTLEQLATHRSGLPNAPRGILGQELAVVAGLRAGNPWAGVGEARYHELVRATPRRLPRRRAAIRYSSLGYGLLGDALAARAGRPYGELLRERVLAPLHLHDTGLDVPLSLPGGSRRGRPRAEIADRIPAAGALRSTVDDLLRWLGACLAPPPGPLGAAIELTRQPRVPLGRSGSIGLAWLVTPGRGEATTVWHNGGTYGFRSFAGFVPERGVAVTVLTNASRDVTRLGHQLVEAAIERR